MAGKKTSKSSKTDHVLNLISGISTNQEESSPAEEKKRRPDFPGKSCPGKRNRFQGAARKGTRGGA